MSLTSLPAQDVCVSSLTVNKTVSTNTVSSLSLKTDTINNVPTMRILTQIRRVSDGASIGQWMIVGEIETIIFNGMLNLSGHTVPANTTVAYIENYMPTDAPVSTPGFVWVPSAPTIEQAYIPVIETISETGDVSFNVDLLNCEDYRRKGLAQYRINRLKGL